eukprot:1160925-Pelagomonas_calceolata.AAC.6
MDWLKLDKFAINHALNSLAQPSEFSSSKNACEQPTLYIDGLLRLDNMQGIIELAIPPSGTACPLKEIHHHLQQRS